MAAQFSPITVAAAQALAAQAGLAMRVVADDWFTAQDGAGPPTAFGPFHRGRFLMNEALISAAALNWQPATAGAEAQVWAPTAELIQQWEQAAGEAALLFVSGGLLDHAAMTQAGYARWFTHSGQAMLRRDQLATRLTALLAEEPALTQLTATAPDAAALDPLYNNYCALTGQWPRYRRPSAWWQALLARRDLCVRGILLPTYDEENPEALTGPADLSGYVVYRDVGGTREFLETVVSVIDGDEDENIDLLLNDTLHTLVRSAFGIGAEGAAGAPNQPRQPLQKLVWHGSPGDLMWSRSSMYGCEMREQTQTQYLKVLQPAVVAEQLIKPAVEQDSDGEFEGELTVDLTDLEKVAFRRKGNRKAGRLTVRLTTADFIACMLHPYRLTGLVQEDGIAFECDDPEIDPMWVVFSSLFDVLHPYWPVLE